MKFNFRKIASVLASVVMLGSTVGIAAAANYPTPFVSASGGDVAVVYGTSAAFSDGLAAGDLQSDLTYQLGKLTATTGSGNGASASGGDSVNLATSARKLYYGDALNTARTTISSTDMPTVLADGQVTSLTGTAYKYTQTISPGSVTSTFGTASGNLNDPILNINVGSTGNTGQLYNYTLSFTKNINVSDATNIQGQKINILGVDYIIGASSDAAASPAVLYLYGAGQTVSLAGGESKTVTIAGVDHTVQLVAATGTTTATISFDGVSRAVTKGTSYSFAGDMNIYVKDITFQNYAGGVQDIELIVGANTLLIQNGTTVKKGADQTAVKGSYATITQSGGLLSSFTISVAMPSSTKDYLAEGQFLTDPVFGGLKVQFAGAVPALNDSSRANLKVDTDNNQFAYVTFTSARAGTAGEQKLTYAVDNDTSTSGIQFLLAHQALAGSKGKIHVLENESAQLYDWIVVNQGDSGTILRVDDISIDTSTSGSVTFSDAITGDSQKVTITNTTAGTVYAKSGVNFFGGTGYNVQVSTSTPYTVSISWSGASTYTVFPRIKLLNGGWIAFLANTTVTATNTTSYILPDGQTNLATSGINLSSVDPNRSATFVNQGIAWGGKAGAVDGSFTIVNVTGLVKGTAADTTCNFGNDSYGPAILYLEPKKWNDGSYGSYMCIPLTNTGGSSPEIKINDPGFNGTNSGYVTYGSDSYQKSAVDQFGTFVTKVDNTNENGVATIAMPSSQMYLDVLFTSDTATITPGTPGGNGNVVNLGNVIVKDSELSSVSTKNLIVVGGSCINTVAAQILGGTKCGADFTTATTVGANQALVKVVDAATAGGTAGKIAMLIAGYEAADTTKAVKYVTTEAPATDAGTNIKLETSSTVATVATTA